MRVVRLELHNYRRHRHTVLELPDGVTAVLGPNGAGKSSLLEALGFALFGLGAVRTNKDLVRLDIAPPGDPVRVIVDLELGGQAVRIERELKGRNLTPTASLTVDGVLLVAPGAGSAEAATGEMERRLGLGADGFFATVVARQRELARLADRTPAERKRLILEMLGIDALDRAIDRAREARRTAEATLAGLQSALGNERALRVAVHEAETASATATAATAAAQQDWTARQQTLQAALRTLDECTQHQARRREASAALALARATVERHQERQTELARRLAEAEHAASRARELGPTSERLVQQRTALDAAVASHEAQRRFEASRAAAEDQRARVQRLADDATAFAVPDDVAPQLAAVASDADGAREALAHANASAAAARAKAGTAAARLAHLGALGSHADCPTCERPLGDRVETLRAATQAEHEAARADAARHDAQAAAAAAAFDQAQRERVRLEALARRRMQALAARDQLAARLADERRRLEAMEAALATQKPTGSMPDLEALRQAVSAAEGLDRERVSCETLAAALPGLHQELRATDHALAGAAAECAALAARFESLPDRASDEAAVRALVVEHQSGEREAERRLHAARLAEQAAQAVAAAARARLAEDSALRARVAALQDDAQLWNALVGARGGGLLDDFKLHLVSRIGPAVATEASRLLARFTDGRYTEVLLDDDYEAYVADRGVHYTLDRFSGGEQDLVHLAIRLAVSRLLAQRSGSELRFLALDEVFGSLDDERRGLVLGALRELSGLYGQVLAVTHLQDLREGLDATVSVQERNGEAFVTVAA